MLMVTLDLCQTNLYYVPYWDVWTTSILAYFLVRVYEIEKLTSEIEQL